MRFYETRARSFVKASTYRLANIVVDVGVIYVLTHRLVLTGGLVIITNITSTILHYSNERFWNAFQWGRRKI